MPVATIDPNEYEKFDLETAPPDGYVCLRPLPYGMKLSRRDKATKMRMRSSGGNRTARGRMSASKEEDTVIDLETASEWAMHFDFAYCIGEHNLQNKDGTLLDFAKPMSIKMLSPRVGSEIERLIFEINEEEDAEDMEDFMKRVGTSSTDDQKKQTEDSTD